MSNLEITIRDVMTGKQEQVTMPADLISEDFVPKLIARVTSVAKPKATRTSVSQPTKVSASPARKTKRTSATATAKALPAPTEVPATGEATTSTAKVWAIADAAAPGTPRKEILAQCVAAGVKIGTAATQYGKWQIARKKQAA